MARLKSETRQMTELVGVRFTPDDHTALKHEARRRGVTVPELLRTLCLEGVQKAS